MAGLGVSAVQEDYLKVIYELGRATPAQPVAAAALVERLGAAPATVTETIKRLAASGLVYHVPYHGVTLTPAGERAALEVIRHHRLLEQYLAVALGLPWDQIHIEADRLEHVLSEALEERIAAVLGHPTHDPHGDPIPAADLTVAPTTGTRLSELAVGVEAIVGRVVDQEPAKLRYLTALGLMPGARLTVLSNDPFDRPIRLRVGGQEHLIGHALARAIFVAPAAVVAALRPARPPHSDAD